ncbi:hypothetical protein PILCRDRAFT_15062 [Piloderma croceum F 1598]|uniref:Uncharacterized protein n=1 Tax=Piloderma croceum (strain F 1598) TaxID=765440 RepID=A0A0C3B8J8_PILCF|nr:hypothetical protein PILCRDRAFT_15062 [Piloderma croceum F 1598]
MHSHAARQATAPAPSPSVLPPSSPTAVPNIVVLIDHPNTVHSSFSTSSSNSSPIHPIQTCTMLSVFSKFNSAVIAVVEHKSNSKSPYMCAGDPTPQTCVDWERACTKYANNKDISTDKIVKRTLDSIEDIHFVNWIKLDCALFEAMTLKEFMTESLSFWEFQVMVQTTNALLKGTPHYLEEQKICECIEGGMDQVLYVQATNVKCNNIEDLCEWLAEVKHLNDEKHFECLQAINAFKQSATASCAAACVGNNAQNAFNNALAVPSHKANTPSLPFANEEKMLLLKYEGCLKCCKPFVYHKGSDKAPDCSFPVGTGYKPITFAAVTAAMPASYKAKVTAIVPVIANTTASSSVHPVATVFPGIANLADYAVVNVSNVLGGAGDFDTSVSTHTVSDAVATILEPVDAAILLAVCGHKSASAPLSVPHVFWRASALAGTTSDDAPAQFDCLIDNGSSLVLI